MSLSLFLTLLFVSVSPLWAGTISLESRITTEIQKDTLNATITVTNRGTEAASSIQLTAKSSAETKQSDVLAALGVEKSHTETFRFSLRGLLPGRYPFVTHTIYTDANAYPFSALAVVLFGFRENVSSTILGTLGSAHVRKSGKLDLKIKNLDVQDKVLTIQLLTPRELSVENPTAHATLSAGSETKLSYVIHNFSALQGSTYATYALIEYEEGGKHFAALAPGTIVIDPPGFLNSIQRFLWPALLLCLVIAILIAGRIYWDRPRSRPI